MYQRNLPLNVSNPVFSPVIPTEQDSMDLESIELLRPKPVQAFVNNNPYLDILDTALLLRLPPCQIRWLAEIGLIPAHALKHDGQTCWKFRLDELLVGLLRSVLKLATKPFMTF